MISLRSPLNFLGYGIVGSNLLKSLVIDHQQDVCYYPMGQIDALPELHQIIQQAAANQEKLDPTAPCLTVWHEHAIHERIGKGKNCGLSFFELDTFSERTKRSIECQDIFLVASQWAADVARKEVPNQDVRVVKMGVDTNYFRPMSLNLDMERPYRFLAVGKTEVRKGHDILHELFNKAFNKDDNVELYVSWDNPFLSPQDKKKWIDLYKNTPLGDKIFFIDRKLDIRPEYYAADCCIFPSRAEAICLPALEAMACGKPLICTNYSGFTEFCNKDNAFLVDIETVEPAVDGIWFHGTGSWAQIGQKQETEFVEFMRHCFKNRINTNPAGRATAEQLTWGSTCQKLLEILNEV